MALRRHGRRYGSDANALPPLPPTSEGVRFDPSLRTAAELVAEQQAEHRPAVIADEAA